MSLNPIILNALKPLGVPIRFQTLLDSDGDPDMYITFFEYNQTSALRADDVELKSRHSIQVDIWSKGDYTDMAKQVKEKLINIGFTRTMETEFFEAETRTYHKVLRFNLVQ
jgi:hypothetical protein